MKRTMIRLLAACAAIAMPTLGHAAITCSISSPGFAAAYSTSAPAANITQTYFTVTCTRGSSSDPTSVNYSVKADNGLNAQGQRNRAASGANRIQYDLYKDAACGTQWRGNTTIAGTVTFPGTGTVSAQGNFWGCIPASQTGLAAGVYTDSVTMTMTYGAPQSTAAGSAGVTITTPPTCSVTQAPGTVNFVYTSFAGPANASTTFGVTCSLALPYTMALDATTGTVIGITYTLGLSASSSTGTGAQQTFSVNGAIAGGQSGTCAGATCVASQTRSLTITY